MEGTSAAGLAASVLAGSEADEHLDGVHVEETADAALAAAPLLGPRTQASTLAVAGAVGVVAGAAIGGPSTALALGGLGAALVGALHGTLLGGTAAAPPPQTVRALRAQVAQVRRVESVRRLLGAATATTAGLVAALVALRSVVAADDADAVPGLRLAAALGALVGPAAALALARAGGEPRRTHRYLAGALAGAAVLAPLAAIGPAPVRAACTALAVAALSAAVVHAAASIADVTGPALRRAGLVASALHVLGGALFGAITGAVVEGNGTARPLVVGLGPLAFAGALLFLSAAATLPADRRRALVEAPVEATAEQREGVVVSVDHIDFSYGHVQVLFDVSVEVRKGETLALLGTNGAGKSTLLRALTGLSPVDRGSIRHRGDDITFASAGDRVRRGIVQLPGGKAVFPQLTVIENLMAGAYGYIWDRKRLARRIDEVLDLFPVLRTRLDQPAGTLSGGEQQMLAFAKALLLDPEVLCIDELSLGLAPVIVQDLIAIVERLKDEGLTMVIVEQSLNVALALADRAVFMEKGRVRFDGPARELAERGDLARAVFLGGGEGG